MKYIVYKTTNTMTGEFYVGHHKTKYPEIFDGYFGSGLLLQRAIKKYGKENFIREILFVFETLTEAKSKEREIVNEEFVKLDYIYNIACGGTGGNLIEGYSDEEKNLIKQKIKETVTRNGSSKYTEDELPTARERFLKIRIQPDNKNRKHGPQQRKNMSDANHMRGARWITNGDKSVALKIGELIPDGWHFGRTIFTNKPHTEESKKKISESISGTVCYTDGKVNIKLKRDDPIPQGFYRGMKQNKKKSRWYTDGINSILVFVDDEIPAGFFLGRTFKRGKLK